MAINEVFNLNIDNEEEDFTVEFDEVIDTGGTTNYNELNNLPQINGVTLKGNKTAEALGIYPYDDTEVKQDIETLQQNVSTNTSDIEGIKEVIPEQATELNQLADKAFVNSSIASSTANFIGTFNSLAELEAYSGPLTKNDYAFVIATDTSGNTLYNRYKYTGTQWLFEYSINNSSFTSAQWDAINSGITTSGVSQISTNANNITALQTGKQNVISSSNKLNADFVDDTNALHKFATANQLSQISTNANDISNLQSDKQDITDNSLATTSKTVPGAINEVNSIAKGANQALSYADYQTMITNFNSAPASAYNIGQNIYILTINVPDLWVSSIEETPVTYTYTTDDAFITALNNNGYVQVGYYKISALETQEVDLTDYVTNTDYASSDYGGVIKTSNYAYATYMSSGFLAAGTKTYANYETAGEYVFISKGTLENIKNNYVKDGVTANNITLTDTEKTNACNWLGTGKMTTLSQVEYDALVSGGTVDTNTYYFIPEE